MHTKQLKFKLLHSIQDWPGNVMSIFEHISYPCHLMASHGKAAWPRGGALSSGWLSWLLWGLSLRSMTLHRRGAHLDAFAFLLWQNDQNVAIRSNQNRFESLESLESVNWGFWGGVDLSEIVDGRDPDGRLKMDGALWSVVAATVNSDRVWDVVVTCVSRLTARYFLRYLYMYISHIIYYYMITLLYIYI